MVAVAAWGEEYLLDFRTETAVLGLAPTVWPQGSERWNTLPIHGCGLVEYVLTAEHPYSNVHKFPVLRWDQRLSQDELLYQLPAVLQCDGVILEFSYERWYDP